MNFTMSALKWCRPIGKDLVLCARVLNFCFIGILSFRLSARYRLISRVLSLLTIILLIQFIQTIIGETFEKRESPVVDFFVQVFIAFLILPVEGYLRNLMLKSLDQNSKLYQLMTRKAGGRLEKNKQE